MKIDLSTKYKIDYTSSFKKQLKKIAKQGKNLKKIEFVIQSLADGESLEEKYRDHSLENDKYYKNCRECHIEPDWLLVYKIENECLILVLVATGSHSELF